MSRSHRIRLLALFAIGLAGSISILGGARLLPRTARQSNDLPKIMFWAWERREDLRYLDPATQGVAFLARTIELQSLPAGANAEASDVRRNRWFDDSAARRGVTLKPRLQPLQVNEETPLMAVVRIESSNDLWHRPAGQESEPVAAEFPYSDAQRAIVADMAAAAVRLPRVKALQIDFDASQSERAFYAALLRDIRTRLPEGMPLSITALASWCIGDLWLDQLAPGTIDEAVPMLFRMGPGSSEVAWYVQSGQEFRSSYCRGSLGVSTDEPFSQAVLQGGIQSKTRAWGSRRIYVFSPSAWTEEGVSAVAREVARWHRGS